LEEEEKQNNEGLTDLLKGKMSVYKNPVYDNCYTHDGTSSKYEDKSNADKSESVVPAVDDNTVLTHEDEITRKDGLILMLITNFILVKHH